MTINREMSPNEIRVLNAIRNSASYDFPIKAKELRQHLGLSKRSLEEIIEILRVVYKHPIVAKKARPGGYYLPKNKEERDAGLAPYRAQIRSEQRTLAAVESIDLGDYWNAQKA